MTNFHQGDQPPMDERRNIQVIQAMLLSFVQAPMLAAVAGVISQTALEKVIKYAKDHAVHEGKVTQEEFEAVFSRIVQQLLQQGMPTQQKKSSRKKRQKP